MRPEEIQQLPSRSAIVRYRNLRPMHLQLTPWWERPDSEQIKKEQLEAAQMREAAGSQQGTDDPMSEPEETDGTPAELDQEQDTLEILLAGGDGPAAEAR